MTVDIKALLKKKTGEVKRPPSVPAGTWRLRVTGAPKLITSREKKTPGFEYPLQVLEPVGSDIDADDLKEFLEFYEGDPKRATKKITFWITEDALSMLTDFFKEVCKLNPDLTIEESNAEVTNITILGTFMKQLSDRGEAYTRLEVTDLAPDTAA